MKTPAMMALAAPLAAGLSGMAAQPPEAEITNGVVRARLYLPDAATGFYRGTRFDWSGVLGSLQFAGHEYYPAWFQRCDAQVHDFIYDGNDIVAGPCTAVTGPAEEFSTNGQGLGFEEAGVGGTFVKIGVGVLRRPDDRPYDPYRLYPIVDGGRWKVERRPDAITFTQAVSDASTGSAYEYRKTVALDASHASMILDHGLRNTGKRAIRTSVYNHNFQYLDRQPPGPGVTITSPFALRTSSPPTEGLAVIRGNQITFAKTLTGEDRVYLDLRGFGEASTDYDFRIEDRRVGAGLRITADRPLSRLALWAIRAPLSLEPFITMDIEPGAEFAWRIRYEYYTVPRNAR